MSPTYEYVCSGCPHKFEMFQPITAGPIKTCPRCGREVVRKIGPGEAVIFRGGGWPGKEIKRGGKS